MASCAFLGLGVMGFPMAGHLRANGHDVRVWNRTATRSKAWAAEHGEGAFESVTDAVSGADFVMLCVGADKDVYAVIDQITPSLKSGAIVIDHTTASPDCARTVAITLTDRGFEFLDAPISGGQSGAEAGTLSVMCGGEAATFAEALPVMQSYGRTITHLGPSGAGQTAKCVNQICIAGALQGLSEGLRFAQAAGLDAETLLAAIGGGAAQSWQMDNRLLTMAKDEFDFGFAIDWMRKDLGIAMDEAARMGVGLPITEQVDDAYEKIQAQGGARQDTSALIRSLPKVSKSSG
ncbi:3-hydroxyisobutyrate dehydrogenase [Algimonas arctica]|uniref:3-hydroxyisobutyrate dehydrogenase n=1 Tax=Algimonas arctica TaxID=1479486 RepID=A0A8J3CNX7_9PROT|nr:NAD(P)-dependent oxidoreductase [Algimonas arctica]GHA83703.1 3-hydroxyisobutyrate dehydrogenase [Algimonas arctica]